MVTAIRVKRAIMSKCLMSLNKPRVYLLLIGNDTVYVGQTGLNSIANRVKSPHSGNIDTTWHTLVAFACLSPSISSNELLFIENALCEYVHTHYPKCATITPATGNCNDSYRISHYFLGPGSINTRKTYITDILFYIGFFGQSLFLQSPTSYNDSANGKLACFYFKSSGTK